MACNMSVTPAIRERKQHFMPTSASFCVQELFQRDTKLSAVTHRVSLGLAPYKAARGTEQVFLPTLRCLLSSTAATSEHELHTVIA